MSLGPVMMDLEGLEVMPEEKEILAHPQVGGVLLFARNYSDPEQLRDLVDSIHKIRQPRLLVAVDQEGGRVQRFRDFFTRLPPVSHLGEIYDRDRRRARGLAQITGWLMAAELRALGIDISFAPVLDLDSGVCAVIGDRAFHSDPEAVADLAQSYQGGMHQAGMAGTGKHFPGHGGVNEDSHYDLPVDQRHFEDLEMEDLLPFERIIHAGLAAIMSAHVVFPEIDPQPASFSNFWLQEVLRERLGFQGVIFSDDLSMGAAASVGEPWERAERALQAGCDMLPVCNAPDAVVHILDHLSGYNDPAAHARLARLHGRPAPNWQELHGIRRWQQAVDVVSSYDEAPLLDMDL